MKQYLGLTAEQATELNKYFLEQPAKVAIPYLKIIQNLPTFNVEEVSEPEPPKTDE